VSIFGRESTISVIGSQRIGSYPLLRVVGQNVEKVQKIGKKLPGKILTSFFQKKTTKKKNFLAVKKNILIRGWQIFAIKFNAEFYAD